MNTQYTAGPWLTKELQVYAEDGNGSTLAHVYDPSRDHDHSEAEANARLIAAAPELLEECKAAQRRLRGLSNGLLTVIAKTSGDVHDLAVELRKESEERYQTLERAIAKATNP